MKKTMDLKEAVEKYKEEGGDFLGETLKKQLIANQYRVSKDLNPKVIKGYRSKTDTSDVQDILNHLHLETPFMDESKYWDKKTSQDVISVLIAKMDNDAENFLNDLKFSSLEKMFKQLPDEKKFRRLFYESMNSGWDYYKNNNLWYRAMCLHSIKIDPNLIFNHLTKRIELNKTMPFLTSKAWEKYWDGSGGSSDEDKTIQDFYPCGWSKTVYKKLMTRLSKFYTPDRICVLSFNYGEHYFSDEEMKDILDMMDTAKESGFDPKKIMMKQPKSLEDVHDYLEERIEEEELIANSDNFDLNQREDFLKLDNKEIQVLDQTLVVKVPRTRHDLAIFSRKSVFDNCIGKSSGYAESVRDGRSSVVGVFDKNNKPLYCIQTSKYSFLQAKGVSNSEIPKQVLRALESVITVKPELPKDFIGVDHSFIFGYSYNPKTESLFVMFRKNEHIYEYTGVSMDTYEDFAKTKAKGQMLNAVIKKYPCHRLNAKTKPKRIAAA